MDAIGGLILAAKHAPDAMLSTINAKLAVGGLSITYEDAQMLARRRIESLECAERIEFGTPAVVVVADAVATSPCIAQDDVGLVLAELQDCFYELRDELPISVPDAQIAEALRGCLDAWGDVTEVARMPAEDVMVFSDEYVRAIEAERSAEYRIVDYEGHEYTFDPAEWDYDEQADGWNGEKWADDWKD